MSPFPQLNNDPKLQLMMMILVKDEVEVQNCVLEFANSKKKNLKKNI